MTVAGEVSVEEAWSRLAAGEAVALDVRELDEWTAGRVAGAVHVPLGVLPASAAELDPGRPLIAICRSGGRSAEATAYLAALGFSVDNMAGGMKAWHAAGLPIEPAGGWIA